MKSFYVILFSILFYSASAQTFVAKKVYGTFYSDQKAFDVETDVCGDIYTCGILKGAQPASFDTVLINTYSGFGTGVLAKHSIDGTAMWVRTFGSNCFNGACAYYDITCDAQCNIYACGEIACGDLILDADTFPTTGGKLIVKYDQYGNRLWFKIFETPYMGSRFGIDYSNTGEIFIATAFSDSINVEGQIYYTLQPNDQDPLIVKLRSDGSVIWSKKFGGISQEFANSIATDDSGKFYFSGQFHSSAIFDQDTVPCFGIWGNESSYLVSCDSSGNVNRAMRHGYGSDFYRVNKNGKGEWLASAEQGLNAVHSKLTYDQVTSSYFGYSSQTGGIDPPKAYGSCGDANGNMYVTGSFDDHFSLAGNGNNIYVSYPGNRYESYFGIYNETGVLIALENIPNPGYNDAGNAIAFLPPNLLIVAGEEGEFTGNKDYYLAIYDVATLLQTSDLNKPAMSVFPDPVKDKLSLLLNNFYDREWNVDVYSMTGTKIKSFHDQKTRAENIYSYEVGDLEAGIYLVRVSCKNASLSKIIIKN